MHVYYERLQTLLDKVYYYFTLQDGSWAKLVITKTNEVIGF